MVTVGSWISTGCRLASCRTSRVSGRRPSRSARWSITFLNFARLARLTLTTIALGRLTERAAGTNTTVLLEGESGTDKELFARVLHTFSPRARGAFVAINCAAIPEALLESELFGHEKGAFTGAVVRKPGKFEIAHRGTLFLDEIGDLPLALQAKILRALEGQSFERVGGTALLQVDVRVVAATNQDLRAGVVARRFREGLFFRLSVFPIRVPRCESGPAISEFWPSTSSIGCART